MVDDNAKFQGSVPVFYDRFLGNFYFEPYAAELARRLAVGREALVLEVACGTGILTRRLRAAMPKDAQLVATDLSDAMIEYARSKLWGADIHWRTADAQALPFKDGAFDAVVCQFGLTLLPDKALGFREARRVLKPGGTLLANVWCSLDDNPTAAAAHRTLAAMFPDDPPHFLDTLFGFHDAQAIEATAREAGFANVAIERVDIEGHAPSARHVAMGFARGLPLAAALREREADIEAVVDTIARALRDGDGPMPYAAPLSALVVTAT